MEAVDDPGGVLIPEELTEEFLDLIRRPSATNYPAAVAREVAQKAIAFATELLDEMEEGPYDSDAIGRSRDELAKMQDILDAAFPA